MRDLLVDFNHVLKYKVNNNKMPSRCTIRELKVTEKETIKNVDVPRSSET